jgi:hypothetical protein
MTLAEFLDRFPSRRKAGDGWLVLCPNHNDRDGSLSVAEKAGKILVNCQAGCEGAAVIAALGLTWKDLRTTDAPIPARQIVCTYDYRDLDGTLRYQKVRYEPKDFRQRRPDGAGGWIWNLQGIMTRVWYRLPGLKGVRRILCLEGEKDCDRAWALGVPSTTTVEGASEKPGAPLPHAEAYVDQLVQVGCRAVVLCPDHDRPGWRHLAALARAIWAYAPWITVCWLVLPGIAALGGKADLSDWLDAGHSQAELVAAVEAAPVLTPETGVPPEPWGEEPAVAKPPDQVGIYSVKDGAMARVKSTKDGPVVEPLCNFTARVAEEWLLDDGQEASRAFVLEGRLASGEALPAIRVPVDKFSTMSWPLTEWGLRAVVRAGVSARDYLREAIQALSGETAMRRRVFTHTGWRDVEGTWVYLTASGAVGREDIEVELGPGLDRYRLPTTPEDPVRALQASLRLLGIGPLRLTVPLLGSVYRAALGTALPVDYMVWIEGQTGSLKSSLAALFLSHWGAFERLTIPAGWSATVNALEKMAFAIKDAWLVVDDYAPQSLDARDLEQKAQRLLRAQGNLSGRARLRSDATARMTQPPRGLIVSTGEGHPPGHSLLSRTLLLECELDTVDRAKLTAAQKAKAALPHALAAFVQWAAPQMGGGLEAWCRETFEARRTAATIAADASQHARVPEVLAHVAVGLEALIRCATELGALEAMAADRLRADGWTALQQIGERQALQVEAERPSRRFFAVLQALISQRRVTLLRKEQRPENAKTPPEPVGWWDDDFLYLSSDGTYQAVARFCRDAGDPVTVRQQRLFWDCVKEGIVESGGPDRSTTVVELGKKSRRILKVNREVLDRLLEAEFTVNESVNDTAENDATPF